MKFPAPLAQVQAAGLLDVGTLVFFEDGQKMLIGNCNEQLGWCGCSAESIGDSLVVRLHSMWSEGAENPPSPLMKKVTRLAYVCSNCSPGDLRQHINDQEGLAQLLVEAIEDRRSKREFSSPYIPKRDLDLLRTYMEGGTQIEAAAQFQVSVFTFSGAMLRAVRRLLPAMYRAACLRNQ